MASKDAECVKVVVRCRPMNQKEIEDSRTRVVEMDLRTNQVRVKNPKDLRETPKPFTFDKIYDWNSMQEPVFLETAQPIIDQVIGGYNGTIFAYGQTGTGKTFTMEGVHDVPELRGILPRTFRYIFDGCEAAKSVAGENAEFLVRASYLEIYNEEIRDLLSKDHKKQLQLKESVDQGVYVKDLSMFVLKSVQEIEHVFNVGSKNRSVGATQMNQDSSRSHSIFTIVVESSAPGLDGENHLKMGKLHLVDLAGSERSSKTGATGSRALEGIKINLSLTALGNVISCLVDGKSTHIPYRDSKLTRMLQDALGGNAKTVMVANMGPADYNYDETMSTLRYANRAKNIKNKPRINEDPKDAMLREFQDELEKLREQAAQMGSAPRVIEEVREVGMSAEDVEAAKAQAREEALRNKETRERQREEAARLARERSEEAEMESRKRADMAQKLADMEAQQAKAGGDAEAIQRTAELERQKREQMERNVEQAREKERQMQDQLRAQHDAAREAEERFENLQAEAEEKTRKLEKLRAKKDEAHEEWLSLQDEFRVEREETLEELRDLEKHLKLDDTIIQHFVPEESVVMIQKRATWDEQLDNWVLAPLAGADAEGNGQAQLEPRPRCAVGDGPRPLCEYARIAASTSEYNNPRFRHDNILSLELDPPERTTQDYDGEGMDGMGMGGVDPDMMSPEEYAMMMAGGGCVLVLLPCLALRPSLIGP